MPQTHTHTHATKRRTHTHIHTHTRKHIHTHNQARRAQIRTRVRGGKANGGRIILNGENEKDYCAMVSSCGAIGGWRLPADGASIEPLMSPTLSDISVATGHALPSVPLFGGLRAAALLTIMKLWVVIAQGSFFVTANGSELAPKTGISPPPQPLAQRLTKLAGRSTSRSSGVGGSRMGSCGAEVP